MKKLLIAVLLFPVATFAQPKPKVSNIVVKVTTGRIINLTTNVPSFALVRYGANCGNLNLVASDNKRSTSHAIPIEGLNFGTKYCYQIEAKDLTKKIAKTKKEFFITEKFVK